MINFFINFHQKDAQALCACTLCVPLLLKIAGHIYYGQVKHMIFLITVIINGQVLPD